MIRIIAAEMDVQVVLGQYEDNESHPLKACACAVRLIPLPRRRRRKVYERLRCMDHEVTEVTLQGLVITVFDRRRHVHVGYASACLKSKCGSVTCDPPQIGYCSSATIETPRFDPSLGKCADLWVRPGSNHYGLFFDCGCECGLH